MEEEIKKPNGEDIFERALSEIKLRQERAALGFTNCIPLPFKRASQFYPGTEKGNYLIYAASSGIGKSKIVRYLHVIVPYEFIKENPEIDIRLKIFFFSLEESKEKFMMSLISYWLYKNYQLRVSIKQLRSVGQIGNYLSDDIIAKIELAKDYFKDLEKYVTIIDDVHNPTGVYKIVQSYIEKKGHWTKKSVEIKGEEVIMNDRFIHDDPELYVECIVDHVGLFRPEMMDGKRLTLHETMGLWSSRYAIEMRNKYNAIVIDIQQFGADKEKKQFTFKGNSIDEKLEPSLDGLAGNKETQRNADYVFGVFAPDRYQIEEYMGYDIKVMQDHFRSMIILKSRDGESNIRIPLYFDGACNVFKELPPPNDPEIERVYVRVREIYNN
jgi:hypothetical protein